MKIAIDGPAGSGKSTVSRELAKRTGYFYLDTGAMFRALTWYFLKQDMRDEEKIETELRTLSLSLMPSGMIVNGVPLQKELRTEEIDQNVSYYSGLRPIRDFLAKKQRQFGHDLDVILDGRDIGTTIFPDAELKFFLVASAEVRARRRALERNDLSQYGSILEDIRNRDTYDSTRKISPLRKAADAIEIDTSLMTAEEVVNRLYEEWENYVRTHSCN